MTTPSITPGAVVVGYSGERDAEHALAWAADQAALEKRTLALVHVLAPLTGFADTSLMAISVVEELNKAMNQGGRDLLAAASASVAQTNPTVDVEIHLLHGSPANVLRDLSEHASCVVVGSRGRGRCASALLGSVSLSVASNGSCPVVVVRRFHRGKVRNGVLVGTDGTRNTRATLEYAYREASLRQLPLTVLYSVPGLGEGAADVVDDHGPGLDEHRRVLAEAVAGMGERFPDVRVRTCLGSGTPEKWLISQSSAMDLLVVGHHYRGGIADRLAVGSYAPMVVERAACPTAVVFEAPSVLVAPAP